MAREEIIKSFSKHLFWDINPKEMSLDACPSQVISRILEYGEWHDWRLILDYYGLDVIVEEMKRVRTLDPRALSFICCISNTKKEDYRCYRIAQLNPTLWNS